MSHNKKLKGIKKLVQEELKAETVQMEMVMKALKPVNEISQKQRKKFRK